MIICHREDGLNRTFYGIETCPHAADGHGHESLNRTFYGIETIESICLCDFLHVLIVPFMELKLCCASR